MIRARSAPRSAAVITNPARSEWQPDRSRPLQHIASRCPRCFDPLVPLQRIRPDRETGRNTGPSVMSAAETQSRRSATGRTCQPCGMAFSTPLRNHSAWAAVCRWWTPTTLLLIRRRGGDRGGRCAISRAAARAAVSAVSRRCGPARLQARLAGRCR